MRLILDPEAWFEAYLDTPISTPRNVRSPAEAMQIPGCCVKTRERNAGDGFPVHMGRVVSIVDGTVTVRSWRDLSDGNVAAVWIMNQAEYLAMWECD